MNKKLLTFLLPLLILSSSFAWCNVDYDYYTTLLVSHDENIDDYSVLLNVSYNSLVKEDFSDIIFYGVSCELLPYYTQYVNNNSYALFWVKTDIVNGDTPIFMYYSNEAGISYSDFNNAFLVSDDFNDESLNSSYNTTTLAGSCVYNETGGVLNYTADGISCWNYLEMFKWAGNTTIEVMYEYTTVTNQTLGCNDTLCNASESNQGIQIRKDLYSVLGNKQYTQVRGYDFINYDGEIGNSSYSLINSTLIEQFNDSGVYYFYSSADTSKLESRLIEKDCVIVRQFDDLSINVYFMHGDCDTVILNDTESFANSHLDYYNVFNLYTRNADTDYYSVTYDDVRVRKYVGDNSSEYYSSNEPTITVGNSFSYTGEFTEYGRNVGGFFESFIPGVAEFMLYLALVSLAIGWFLIVRKYVLNSD